MQGCGLSFYNNRRHFRMTQRRHILATSIGHIGKEANRWEEELHLGENPEAQIVYGTMPEDQERMWGSLLRKCQPFTVRQLAQESGLSIGEVSSMLSRQRSPRSEMLTKLQQAVATLEATAAKEAAKTGLVLTVTRKQCQHVGLRVIAREAGVNPGHLAQALAGTHRPSRDLVAKLQARLIELEHVHIE